MPSNDAVIENQFFIGVPWKGIRPKFEKALSELKEECPIHCVVFGRNTGQDAEGLWESIQGEIRRSAATVFDVTGSNPNVALEFGFAEALGKKRILTRYDRKIRRSRRDVAHSQYIMSDLAGKVRVSYKNVKVLKEALRKEFENNRYSIRFREFLRRRKSGKREAKIALAVVHELAKGKRKGDARVERAVEIP